MDSFVESLDEWRTRVSTFQEEQAKQAVRLERLHYAVGPAATVLSALAGTTVFARLDSVPDVRIQIALGAVSLLSAILMAVMTFYSYAKRSEQSRSVAARLGTIRREIDIWMRFPPKTELEMAEVLRQLNKEISAIATDAPLISDVGGVGGGFGGGRVRILLE